MDLITAAPRHKAISGCHCDLTSAQPNGTDRLDTLTKKNSRYSQNNRSIITIFLIFSNWFGMAKSGQAWLEGGLKASLAFKSEDEVTFCYKFKRASKRQASLLLFPSINTLHFLLFLFRSSSFPSFTFHLSSSLPLTCFAVDMSNQPPRQMAFRPGPTYLPNQAATIPFKISSVPHRTGAPLLRPLPLDTVYSDPVVSTLNKTYGKPIKDTIRDILAKRGFPPQEYIDDPAGTTFEICQRHVPGDYENTKRLTIYVTAPWASNTGGTSWIKATKDIKTWADKFLHDIDMPERNLNSDPDARTVTGAGARFGIDVEIAALELLAEKFISVPPKIDDWLAGWPHVRDDVAKILQSFVESKSNWSCISLINFGPNESPDKNPTTVYIAMDQACDEHVMWTTIRPAIQEYIDHTPYGWSLHMEHRVSDNQAFDLHALSKKPTELLRFFLGEPYEDNVNLGASISVSSYVPADDGKKYNPMVGTLGCYVELQVDGKWQLFGLTNYHVIRAAIPGFKRTIDALVPERDTPLYKADHEGFFPGTFGSQAVESPSRTYHNATISMLQDSPDSTDEMQQKLEFFDNGRQILGHLWAGSGFGRRTERSGLCDWALVSVNANRVGRNILPDATQWQTGRRAFHASTCVPKRSRVGK